MENVIEEGWLPSFVPTLLRFYSQGDFLEMEYEDALYFYNEAIAEIREAELREIWLAIAFPALGNNKAPTWDEFRRKYSLRTFREKKVKKEAPKVATYQGVDLARMER